MNSPDKKRPSLLLTLGPPLFPSFRRNIIVLLVFIVGCALTLWVSRNSQANDNSRREKHFERSALLYLPNLDMRRHLYEQLLNVFGQIAKNSGDRQDWNDSLIQLNAFHEYPGLMAIGQGRKLQNGKVLIERFSSPNADFESDMNRGIEELWTTGLSTGISSQTLRKDGESYLLLLHPLHESRRNDRSIFALIHLGTFLERPSITGDREFVRIEVFNPGQGDEPAIYRSEPYGKRSMNERRMKVSAFGQSWIVRQLFYPSSSERRPLPFPLMVLGTGLILTVLFSLYVKRLIQGQRLAKELAEKMTVDLVAAREEALAQASVKSRFLATMSHEIRTPLSGLLGMADLLSSTELNESQQFYIHAIQTAGAGLQAVVNDVLDLSKMEYSKLSFDELPFEPLQLIKNQIAIFSAKSMSKNLTLNSFLSPDIPKTLCGDMNRIAQVLRNLLNNALKFTSQGGVSIVVTSERPSADRTDGRNADRTDGRNRDRIQLRFEVRDSGPGLSEEKIRTLFQPYSQGDSGIGRSIGGTGLGLYLSKLLVEGMGGEIGVDSIEDQGSSFWFRLNLITVPERAVEKSAILERNPEFSLAAPSRSREILVAEDQVFIQIVIRKTLERLGYQATIVDNGAALVEAVQKKSYDLILTDCQMPEMNGYEATERIRQLEREGRIESLPIVALSAGVLEEDRQQCLNVGMDDFLAKPFQIDQLRDILQRWLPSKEGPAVARPHSSI